MEEEEKVSLIDGEGRKGGRSWGRSRGGGGTWSTSLSIVEGNYSRRQTSLFSLICFQTANPSSDRLQTEESRRIPKDPSESLRIGARRAVRPAPAPGIWEGRKEKCFDRFKCKRRRWRRCLYRLSFRQRPDPSAPPNRNKRSCAPSIYNYSSIFQALGGCFYDPIRMWPSSARIFRWI